MLSSSQGYSGGEVESEGFLTGKSPAYIKRRRIILVAISAVVVIATLLTIVAFAVYGKSEHNTFPVPLEELITVGNMTEHLHQLQSIADAHNGTRCAGSTGYAESVAYVKEKLEAHGYTVTLQDFTFPQLVVVSTPVLTLTSPNVLPFHYQQDFALMGSFSVDENITAPVTQVPEYGCEDADYAGFAPQTVALVSRGNCTFDVKIELAVKYQAAAAIIYNQGDTPDRTGLFLGSLGTETPMPVMSTTFGLGLILRYQPSTPILNIVVNTVSQHVNTTNIIADTATGRPDRVIVVGSHLDSIEKGPGINDNGSGSALNLELAIRLGVDNKEIKNKVRFAWWAAEELGLLGSHHYMNDLNATQSPELENIVLNLNFDMVGSPNFFRGIYNGTSASKESGKIQILFEDWFHDENLHTEPTAFDGRSDYGPFLAYGKAAGGLFTGAEALKTDNGRQSYGGLANAAYDPCYHLACDTVSNIDKAVYGDMGKAAANALEMLAMQEDLVHFLQN